MSLTKEQKEQIKERHKEYLYFKQKHSDKGEYNPISFPEWLDQIPTESELPIYEQSEGILIKEKEAEPQEVLTEKERIKKLALDYVHRTYPATRTTTGLHIRTIANYAYQDGYIDACKTIPPLNQSNPKIHISKEAKEDLGLEIKKEADFLKKFHPKQSNPLEAEIERLKGRLEKCSKSNEMLDYTITQMSERQSNHLSEEEIMKEADFRYQHFANLATRNHFALGFVDGYKANKIHSEQSNPLSSKTDEEYVKELLEVINGDYYNNIDEAAAIIKKVKEYNQPNLLSKEKVLNSPRIFDILEELRRNIISSDTAQDKLAEEICNLTPASISKEGGRTMPVDFHNIILLLREGKINAEEAVFKASQLTKGREWISVEERLPEQSECLFLNRNGLVGYGFFKGGEFLNYLDQKLVVSITHWMKLPLPPIPNK